MWFILLVWVGVPIGFVALSYFLQRLFRKIPHNYNVNYRRRR
jgi:hypothetical protein